MDEPCTRRAMPGEIVGIACNECGHTNVVHPGKHNPALDACAICDLVALAANLAEGSA